MLYNEYFSNSTYFISPYSFLWILPCFMFLLYNVIACVYLTSIIAYCALSEAIYRFFNRKVSPRNKAVLITGCGSGFGHDLAKRLDSKGFQVFASCLNPLSDGAELLKKSCSSSLHVFGLDITKDESVQEALDYVKTHLNGIELWALVNNAGRSVIGEITWSKMEDFQYLMDVNAMGAVRVTKAFIPLLRKSKGRIINVTSFGTSLPVALDTAYCMSKCALRSFSDCLKHEMYPWGVKVITVEPEFFRTNILKIDSELSKSTEVFETLDDNEKAEYGKTYVDSIFLYLKRIRDLYSDRTDKVTDALEDSISLEYPKDFYRPCRNIIWEYGIRIFIHFPHSIRDTCIHIFNYFLRYPQPKSTLLRF